MRYDFRNGRAARGEGPGNSRIINFYFSDIQRQRFAHFLSQGLAACEDVVLACPRSVLQMFGAVAQKGPHSGNLAYVEMTPDPHKAMSPLLETVLHSARRRARVRLLADFGPVREPSAVLEMEFLLSSGLDGLRIPCVSQYDGKALSGPVCLDRLRQSGMVLFDDFMCRGLRPPQDSRQALDESIDLPSRCSEVSA